jgi:hypothetical protein
MWMNRSKLPVSLELLLHQPLPIERPIPRRWRPCNILNFVAKQKEEAQQWTSILLHWDHDWKP